MMNEQSKYFWCPMNDDMPWVNLTQEEVEELRNKKYELTEYGKQRLREMMTHEEMLEEAERRENEVQENIERAVKLDQEIEERVLKIAEEAMDKYSDAFKELARIERAERILERYNKFQNIECSGLSHGTPITPEFQQAMALECMIDALRCENLNREYNEIAISDIEDLIKGLYQQGRESLKKWEEFKDSADGVA